MSVRRSTALLTDWAVYGERVPPLTPSASLESGSIPLYAVVGITAPAEERVRRITAREGITEE
jgi:hypothetical protein